MGRAGDTVARFSRPVLVVSGTVFVTVFCVVGVVGVAGCNRIRWLCSEKRHGIVRLAEIMPGREPDVAFGGCTPIMIVCGRCGLCDANSTRSRGVWRRRGAQLILFKLASVRHGDTIELQTEIDFDRGPFARRVTAVHYRAHCPFTVFHCL